MKSKLIRVKVWYEHSDTAAAGEITRDLEAALSKAFDAQGDDLSCGAVTVRQVDVGDTPAHKTARPEPDF